MLPSQKTSLFKLVHAQIRQKLSLLMIAVMLGVSNVILEEDRMVHDTRAKIEYREEQSEED